MSWNRSLTVAAAALFMLGSAPALTSAGPPEVFEDPFAFTGPDSTHGFAVFINTTRADFCTAEQVAREQGFIDWIEGGMTDPFPEWALERPAGIETWTPMIIDTPKGVIGHLKETDQQIELWWLDDPEDAFGVGACLDTDDRNTLFARGSATIRAHATDMFGSGLRPVAIDHVKGTAELVGADDGLDYTYSFSWRGLYPCQEPPGRPCEKGKFALSQR